MLVTKSYGFCVCGGRNYYMCSGVAAAMMIMVILPIGGGVVAGDVAGVGVVATEKKEQRRWRGAEVGWREKGKNLLV